MATHKGKQSFWLGGRKSLWKAGNMNLWRRGEVKSQDFELSMSCSQKYKACCRHNLFCLTWLGYDRFCVKKTWILGWRICATLLDKGEPLKVLKQEVISFIQQIFVGCQYMPGVTPVAEMAQTSPCPYSYYRLLRRKRIIFTITEKGMAVYNIGAKSQSRKELWYFGLHYLYYFFFKIKIRLRKILDSVQIYLEIVLYGDLFLFKLMCIHPAEYLSWSGVILQNKRSPVRFLGRAWA